MSKKYIDINPVDQYLQQDQGPVKEVVRKTKEPRTRRTHILLQQSLYNEIAELADLEDRSINDVIHRALEDFIKEVK